MHHAQLGAQLALRATRVNGAQCSLPEPAPGGQQRVIGYQHGFVIRSWPDTRTGQVAVNFTTYFFQGSLQLWFGSWLFAQYHLAYYTLHIRVLECNL